MKKLITVIIPTHNRHSLLVRAVEHVKNQTYKNVQIIIADDCSTDTTAEIALSNPEIIYLKNSSNLGYAANMKNALKYAEGEYIYFATDDDTVGNSIFFEKAVEQFEKDSSIDTVFSRLAVLHEGSLIHSRRKFNPVYSPDEFFSMLSEIRFSFLDYFGLSTFVFKREIINRIKPFETQFPESSSIDLTMMIQCAAKSRSLAFIDCIGYIWHRDTPDSLTNKKKSDLAFQTISSVSAAIDLYRYFDADEQYIPLLNAYIEYIFPAILGDYYAIGVEEKMAELLPSLAEKQVYIYCRGWVGLRIKKFLEENGVKILSFIDDYRDNAADAVTFDAFTALKGEKTVIIASTKHKDVLSIYKKLHKLSGLTVIDLF